MTDNKPTVGDQAEAIRALASLATAFPTLPSDSITIGTVVAPHGIHQGIRVHLHTKSADFEAWREALNIAPEQVAHCNATNIQTLTAHAVVGGVAVELIAYMPRYAVAEAA
ncbi:hypothetical protein ACWDZ6_06095 [Streptomyces sp. NPDC002926]